MRNFRHDSFDPDECPKTNRMEEMLDRADFLRDEMKDRRIEEMLEKSDFLNAERKKRNKLKPK
jgi:hypothetical protein